MEASFLDELEKIAAASPRSALTAFLLGSLAGGGLARVAQGGQDQTDRIVHAVGGMSARDLEARRARRGVATGVSALAAGAAAVGGLGPARARLARSAGRFMDDVATPALHRAEGVAGRASKQVAKDIADALVERGTEAGRNFGTGVRENLDPGSLVRSLRERFRGR